MKRRGQRGLLSDSRDGFNNYLGAIKSLHQEVLINVREVQKDSKFSDWKIPLKAIKIPLRLCSHRWLNLKFPYFIPNKISY